MNSLIGKSVSAARVDPVKRSVLAAVLHGRPEEDERVPLGDVFHLTLQVEGLLRRLPHVLEDGLAALPCEESRSRTD